MTIPPLSYDETVTDPFPLAPAPDVENPVLTAADITGFGAVEFVADPFLFIEEDEWHLFFEVANTRRVPPAVIGHATSNDRGSSWVFDDIVLEADTHLAFPYVFKWDGAYYMIPDTWHFNNRASNRPASINLYRTTALPDGWRQVATLVSPSHKLQDLVAIRYQGRWWGIAGDGAALYVYYSDNLEEDDWHPHPENPVVKNRPRGARPAGRPIVRNGRILLFMQDCVAEYGTQVRAFEIRQLSPTAYADRELSHSPVLEPAEQLLGWNAGKMHHIDAWYIDGRWRCAVDGNIGFRTAFGRRHWSIGIYDATG